MLTSVISHPKHYTHTDDPHRLAALLRGAIIGHAPVDLIWCEGANVWDEGEADICVGTVLPLSLAPRSTCFDSGYVRVRTEEYVEMDVPLRDIAEADVLQAESEAVA